MTYERDVVNPGKYVESNPQISSIISTSSTTFEEQLLDFWIGGFDDMVHFSTSARTGDLFGALKPPKTEVFFFGGGDLEIWK